MHLYFENVATHMFWHWTGKYYPKNDERNLNKYTIPLKEWVEISKIIEASRPDMLPDIRCSPCNIIKYYARFKAAK